MNSIDIDHIIVRLSEGCKNRILYEDFLKQLTPYLSKEKDDCMVVKWKIADSSAKIGNLNLTKGEIFTKNESIKTPKPPTPKELLNHRSLTLSTEENLKHTKDQTADQLMPSIMYPSKPIERNM